MSDFEDAFRQLHPACIHCGEETLLEKAGAGYFCQVCGKTSPALSMQDERFLRGIHVEPED